MKSVLAIRQCSALFRLIKGSMIPRNRTERSSLAASKLALN